jgi:hypothetical protein
VDAARIAQELIDRNRLGYAALAFGLDPKLIFATAIELGWLGRFRDASVDARRQRHFSRIVFLSWNNTILVFFFAFKAIRHDLI